MTTQMCFDANAIRTWLAARRSDGIVLSAIIGSRAADPQRLMTIGARIGVKDTRRFVMKNARFVTKMLRSGGFYRPDDLMLELAPMFADPVADVSGIHLYTFNGVEATEGWRRSFLESWSPEPRHDPTRQPPPGGAARTLRSDARPGRGGSDRCRGSPARSRRMDAGRDRPSPHRRRPGGLGAAVPAAGRGRVAALGVGRAEVRRRSGGPTEAVLLDAFATGRRALVDHVRSLDPAGWARSGTHQTMGVLDVEAMLRETIAHDEEHLASIERSAPVRRAPTSASSRVAD